MDILTNEYSLIQKVFEHQVAISPEAIAVKFGNTRLSYRELNHRANFLAQQLRQIGAKRGNTIALIMDRSPEMIIAMLAILKAGSAYLPIETSNPLERSLHCLNEANISIIITDRDVNDLIEGLRIVISTDDSAMFDTEKEYFSAQNGETDDLCYVMYTSGSTGNPKGVMVPHRAVIRLVKNTNYIQITESDSILQFAALSFDASTFEIWGALLNGATLVLYTGQGLDPNLFAQEIKDNNVTVLWLTAALFHMLASRYLDALSTVKILLAGGDVLFPDSINTALDQYPDLTVINGYGPTENTTFTCCHRMNKHNRPDGYVPIGQAITGTDLHLLDENFNTVPLGQTAELFVSGKGVALGYVGLSKNGNFFHNKNIAPGLIYATGDWVRENENGELEFKGRIDNQVKIRGFRVSLEEIQSNIIKLNKVKEALVLLRKFDSGEQQLVAFLQLKENHNLCSKTIKNLLAEHMPSYMIPDVFHLNKPFPICKNGKIDRKQLSICTT